MGKIIEGPMCIEVHCQVILQLFKDCLAKFHLLCSCPSLGHMYHCGTEDLHQAAVLLDGKDGAWGAPERRNLPKPGQEVGQHRQVQAAGVLRDGGV